MQRRTLLGIAAAALAGVTSGIRSTAAADAKTHRLAIHVDQRDPAVMNLALNNAKNAYEHYHALGEEVAIEIVAYSGGLHMLRADTSPVKDRITALRKLIPHSQFSACGNTKAGMEKSEGKEVPLITEATLVPSGVVRLMELQEQGWSYVRP